MESGNLEKKKKDRTLFQMIGAANIKERRSIVEQYTFNMDL